MSQKINLALQEHLNTKTTFLKPEKYTKGVTSVESILMLDRLRQNVAVKELLQSAGRPLMRKTASVPNFSHVSRLEYFLHFLFEYYHLLFGYFPFNNVDCEFTNQIAFSLLLLDIISQ